MRDTLTNVIRKLLYSELKMQGITMQEFGKGIGSEGGPNAQSKMAQNFFRPDRKMTIDELEKAGDYLDMSVDSIILGAKQIQMTGKYAKNITNYGTLSFDEREQSKIEEEKKAHDENKEEQEIATILKGMTPEARHAFLNLLQAQQK